MKDYGVLLFKYNDLSIPVTDMLECFSQLPLVGTRTKKSVSRDGTGTYWFAFMKLPEGEVETDEKYEVSIMIHEATQAVAKKYEEKINELEERIEMGEWYEGEYWKLINPDEAGFD